MREKIKAGSEPDFPPGLADQEPARRGCDYPGCEGEGLYRAPRSRVEIRSYYWFCLEHVRAYNRGWDYFRGMSQREIERFISEDVTGHRPTWPFGTRGGYAYELAFRRLHAAFGAFAGAWFGRRRESADERARRRLSPRELALAVLDLERPVSRAELKARYKELVKRHHPDANGGSKRAEERLKLINQAYSYLMSAGYHS